jgi:hypothetical protein
MSEQFSLRRSGAVITGCFVLLLSSLLAAEFVGHQLGSYDLSPLIDLQWRLSTGEAPGRDFINTWPYLLLVLVKAIGSPPFAWPDLTLIYIAATLATFIWLLAAGGLESGCGLWTLAISMALSMPLLYTNHIWHSTLSQLAAVLFFHSSFRLLRSGAAMGAAGLLALVVSAGLVAISKQNIGPPALAACVAYCFLFERSARGMAVVVLALAGAAAGIAVSLWILDGSLEGFVYTYLAVINRINPDASMWHEIRASKTFTPQLVLSLCLVGVMVSRYRNGWRGSRADIYPLFMLGASALPVMTDWDVKINDSVLPLFILAGWLFPGRMEARETLPREGSAASAGALAPVAQAGDSSHIVALFIYYCLFMVALVGGYDRERMRMVGPFYEKPAGLTIDRGYFRGLETGPAFYTLINEMRAAASRSSGPVFFGPRIEFGYMENARRSPRGMPLWWHPGTSYDIRDAGHVLDTFKAQGFEMLIFARGDRTRMPGALIQFIEGNYQRTGEYAWLDVYVRKQ